MTASALHLFSAAMALPEDDRLDLASRLLASVGGEAAPNWDDAWLAELDRREAEVLSGAPSGSAWSEVRSRIASRLSSK